MWIITIHFIFCRWRKFGWGTISISPYISWFDNVLTSKVRAWLVSGRVSGLTVVQNNMCQAASTESVQMWTLYILLRIFTPNCTLKLIGGLHSKIYLVWPLCPLIQVNPPIIQEHDLRKQQMVMLMPFPLNGWANHLRLAISLQAL